MCKTIRKIRARKMKSQTGHCHYCRQPMWSGEPDEFCRTSGIRRRFATSFQCTAEHLVPRSEGGGNRPGNIVAACRYCNQNRHRSGRTIDADIYLQLVRRRIGKGRWCRLPEPAAADTRHPD